MLRQRSGRGKKEGKQKEKKNVPQGKVTMSAAVFDGKSEH